MSRVEVVHTCALNLAGSSVYSGLLLNGAITYAVSRDPLSSEVYLLHLFHATNNTMQLF